jgi:hypothetical protein
MCWSKEAAPLAENETLVFVTLGFERAEVVRPAKSRVLHFGKAPSVVLDSVRGRGVTSDVAQVH